MGKWDEIRKNVSEAFFPSSIYCIVCGSMIDRSRLYAVCDSCMKKLHWNSGRTCEKCGKALNSTYRGRICYDCMLYGHVFTRGYSCLTYGMYERELLFGLKYNGRGYLAEKFADMLYDRISCENIQSDVIISVPVSRRRLRRRGYNQASLIGKALAERTGLPFYDDVLTRVKDTPFLRGFSPVERVDALRGVFAAAEHRIDLIRDSQVILVDDIYTTGATADACSEALFGAGAASVVMLALASGGNRRPSV